MRIVAITVAGLLALAVAGASAQGVNDAQIAHIVVTANQVDIDAGKVAAAMATNPEVKRFGQQMVTDHTGVNKQAGELAAKLKVTPADNPTSQSLKAGGDKNVATLKTLKGAAFDKAYIDHEVTYHQAVLQTAQAALGAAQNAELKSLIQKAAPNLQAHLEHAQKIQSKLGAAGGATGGMTDTAGTKKP
jgi:putative membrane protein